MRAAKRRAIQVLTVLAALSVCAVVSASPANGAVVSYCNQSVWSYSLCPNNFGSSHPRHTYKDNYGQWGTQPHYGGCDVVVEVWAFVAYSNSTASNAKYFKDGCNYVYHSFPNNTEYLRPYVAHRNHPNANYLHGDAAY